MISTECNALLNNCPETQYGSTITTRRTKIESANLAWYNISVRIKKYQRLILEDVSGVARKGEMTALMGASGAGKTTLLNTLLSRNLQDLRVDGEVIINGFNFGNDITSISGYVQQEGLFIPSLTVKEHLYIQSCFRLPAYYTHSEREQRVFQVMKEIGLIRCRDVKIGCVGITKGISGGEAKKLALASELLNNPSILFCDEPTTGLDSYTAESVIQCLSKLSRSGRTIICTIHQPASVLFNLFDRVLFLASGKVAYIGTPMDALNFMNTCGFTCSINFNPADFIIQTLAVVPEEEDECRNRIQLISDSFYKSDFYKRIESDLQSSKIPGILPESRKKVSFYIQTKILIYRCFTENLRNFSLIRTRFLQKFLMALFLGMLYLNTFEESSEQIGISNISAALYFFVCEFTYPASFGILTLLPSQYPLLVREYHDGLYSLFSFYIAKIISYLPIFTLDGTLFLLISYWMIGLSLSINHIFYAVIIALLIEQSSSAFGFMFSAICPSYPVAISIVGPFLTLFSLTGGLYANIGHLPPYISWMQHISWFKYGFEALMVNQWSSVANGTCAFNDCVKANEILADYSFFANNFAIDLIFLFSSAVLFYVFGFIGLFFRVKRAR